MQKGLKMAKNAIVLLNMGGPNNLHEVEVFLKNMFADENILTTKSKLLRRFIGGMITLFRTEEAQEVYRQLGGKSPIVDLTKDIVRDLQNILDDDVEVDFAMRYTPPYANEVVAKLKKNRVENIYLIPMYPQYSTTTTKSSLDDFELALKANKFKVMSYEIKHYFENSKYNEAIIDKIKDKVSKDDSENYDLIFSAHGLPQKIVDNGDVYELHIKKHVELLKKKLKKDGYDFNNVHLAYQSKVGPMKWLEPSLQTCLESLLNKKVIIYPIAFTVDNSETLFELCVEYKEIADELGYDQYVVCECVNNHPLFIESLKEIYTSMKNR